MMPTPAQLKAEITTGPLAAALASTWAAGDDSGTLAILNDPARVSASRPVRMGAFAVWLASRGLLRKISDAKAHANDFVASAALLLGWKLQGEPEAIVDPLDPVVAGMLGAFVAGGVATQADVDAFVASCVVPCSRLTALGWSVSLTQIGEAR